MEAGQRISGVEVDLVLLRCVPANIREGYSAGYHFKITLHNKHRKIGHVNFRFENLSRIIGWVGHIGYSVVKLHQGHRYAEKACRLLVPLFQKHQFQSIILTCCPSNPASKKTIENLGAEYIECVNVPESDELYKSGETQKLIYVWRFEKN